MYTTFYTTISIVSFEAIHIVLDSKLCELGTIMLKYVNHMNMMYAKINITLDG